MFLIYSSLYTIAIIILFLPQYFKRPKELRHKWLREKFGFLNSELRTLPAGRQALNSKLIWIHAVSVGEVNASIQLIKKLKSRYPQLTIVLSTITDTGQKVAMEKSPEGTYVVYLPFDMKFVLNRCFRRFKPKIFIVIETEIWPNIFRFMADQEVPVITLNGRISEKSSKGYKKISFFMKKVLSYVKMFGMQSKADADRLRDIGADREKIAVLGNFKFDMDMPEKVPAWAAGIKGPVIVAGSTHRGEEEIILSAYIENLNRFPELKLILAPRHPERFREVEDILKAKGIAYIKRSALGSQLPAPGVLRSGVILLDSIGELSAVYGVADISIIGKSLTGFGGQNPLEPAYWGRPVLCGPHMENFPFIKDFYQEGAAFEVDGITLAKKIKEFLVEPEKAKAVGTKAKELYTKNSGAVDRAMEVIKEYIG